MAGEGSVVVVGGGSSGGGGTPGGSDKQVQYNNAGALGGISNGNSGQILTSGGAGAVPAFADAAAGPSNTPAVSHQFISAYNSTTKAFTQAQPTTADISGYVAGSLVLLSAQSGAGGTALNFTSLISATYNEYILEFVDIVPGGSPGLMILEVSTDNGGTYDATSGHYQATQISSGGGQVAADQGISTSIIIFPYTSGRTMTTQANMACAGTLRISNPNSTTLYKQFLGSYVAPDSAAATTALRLQSAGLYQQAAAFNAFRIRVTSGTFTGSILLYGVAKS
jgi:hypothetical protein